MRTNPLILYAHALRSIHLFSPLLKGDQVTAFAQISAALE